MTKNPMINKKNKFQEWLSFGLVIVLALAIRIFIMELFFVPSSSMQATILENEYIFSTKYSYGYSNYSPSFFSVDWFKGRIWSTPPKRGDIIIFRPPHNMDTRYIKRLIGMPGDKVQLIDDVIYINDQKIDHIESGKFISEKGQEYKKYKEILPEGLVYFSYKLMDGENKLSNTEAIYVPNDHYFFLGDNRDQSNDSRYDLGFVPFENFIAKGQFILFSTKVKLWDEDVGLINQIIKIGPWLTSIRFDRIFTCLYSQDK